MYICQTNKVKTINPRKKINRLRLGNERLENEEMRLKKKTGRNERDEKKRL